VLDSRLPADDPRLAYPHHNLGSLLLDRGRTYKAERELRKAYELRRRALGDRHPETAMTLGFLARALADQLQYEPAEAAARQVVEVLADNDLFGAASARLFLGQLLFYQERHEESLAALNQGIAELEPLVGGDHSLILKARGGRAQVLLALGRLEEGMAELQLAIAGLEKLGSVGDDARGELLSILGEQRRREGRPAEALELHRRTRQIIVRNYGKDHYRIPLTDFQIAIDILADPAAGDEATRRARAVALITQARNHLRRIDPHHAGLAQIERRLAEIRKP
jgi:serine/threonine-protein kinase